MSDFERLRVGMVDGQVRVADVTDHRILQALLTAPREDYVPEDRRDVAYLDMRLPLGVPGRAMLEPMTFARLLQLAAPREGERVLVVGCGYGYGAAVFLELGLTVTALEASPELARAARERLAARNAIVIEGPLEKGAPQQAPFDLIFCEGAVASGLDELGAQLAPHGRIVAPAGPGRATKATVFRLQNSGLSATTFFDAYGPPLPGFGPAEAFAF